MRFTGALGLLHHAQEFPHREVVGLEAHGLRRLGGGFVETAPAIEDQAEVRVPFGVAGGQPDGLGVLGASLFEPA
jgi:hypothetical protein